MGKFTSVPASLRLAILFCEVAGWIAMAAAFHNNPNINFMTDNVALTCILIIRIIYLIVFVIGSVVSFVFLLVAYSDRTYGLALPIALFGFIWTIGEFTISVFSALAESHVAQQSSTETLIYSRHTDIENWWYTYVLNKGAFAVAAVFGFLASVLNTLNAIIVVSTPH